MASGGQDFRSVSGQAETAEPAQADAALQQTPTTSRDTSPVARRQASTAVPSLRKQPSSNLAPQLTSSAAASPYSSQNTSPIRPSIRQETPQTVTRAGGLRSRKNSHDASPSRPPTLTPTTSTVPSAASIQRALSATSVPQLHPGSVTEALSRLPRAQRSGVGSGENTPHWSASPRIKSPPPSISSRRNSLLAKSKTEPGPTPTITVQSSTPSTATPPMSVVNSESGAKDDQLQANTKAPSRGPSGPKPSLETVEENTPPASAILAANSSVAQSPATPKPLGRSSDDDGRSIREHKGDESMEKSNKIGESESEGNKSDERGRKQQYRMTTAPRPKTVPAKNQYTPLSSAKSRQADGVRNMTVETEVVASIPQTALNAGLGDRSATGPADVGGSIRLKPSNETIRPRKERKRASRKAPSINNGTASSKADIFEQRVANAVNEANSSDSDETFVYESNPPEPQHRPRHHSRTPSATSAHSQAETHRGARGYGGVMDTHRVAGKRSMKFSNNPYNALDSPTDIGNGTVRAHPRHFGRLGRAGGSHASLYSEDSPFTQASKLRTNLGNPGRHSSRPNTPRSTQSGQRRPSGPWTKKSDLSQYDFDGDGADDERNERTPLIGSVRTSRSIRHPHRINSGSARSIDYYGVRQRSWLSRFGGCMLGLIVIVLIVMGAVGFLVMSNKPLYDVEVKKIQNVLASEQEIMLDLLVGAVNPNVLGVTVMDMDVNVFAKSKHVGSSKFWREHGFGDGLETTSRRRRRVRRSQPRVADSDWQDPSGHWQPPDRGTNPIDDREGDAQTMLLGRIFHFDQALTFEGSPIKRHPHFSVGELRLPHPGNKTEMGGTERWERVLQFPFELIVRGVLKYQLPISSRAQTHAIGASVLVHPEEGIDEQGRMRVEVVDRSEEWQWIEFDNAEEGR